jgi:hypothetical protein
VLIVELAMHDFMLEMQHALAIWLALVALVAAAVGVLIAVIRRRDPRRPRQTRQSRQPLESRQPQEAQAHESRDGRRKLTDAGRARGLCPPSKSAQLRELRRYADEVAVAAAHAAVTAEHRRTEWVSVQRTQEATWRAYETAEQAARRVSQAAAFPTPALPNPEESLTASELTARRRYLVRVATEAHDHGELSAEQLCDALLNRNGWDSRRHPFEQDMTLRYIARDRLLRAYQEASVIECAAWHAADLAAAAKRSLDDEAFAAELRVRLAQSKLSGGSPQPRRLGAIVRVPTTATP